MNPEIRALKEWYKPIVIGGTQYLYDPEQQTFYTELLGHRFAVTTEQMVASLQQYLAYVQRVCAPDFTFLVDGKDPVAEADCGGDK